VVVVEQPWGRFRRYWRWRGRVVSVQAALRFQRVGIEFLGLHAGPIVAIRPPRARGRGALVRLDPPWSPSPWPFESDAERANPPRPDAKSRSPSMTRVGFMVSWLVLGFGFVADHLTKTSAFAAPKLDGAVREILPGLCIGQRVQNAGALGGLGAGHRLAPYCVAFVALCLTGLLANRAHKNLSHRPPFEAIGWGLLLAGMLGNLADRLVFGYVRDFLFLGILPALTFNLADLLVIGGALCVLLSQGQCKRSRPPRGKRPIDRSCLDAGPRAPAI
jgi:signal peptidase II